MRSWTVVVAAVAVTMGAGCGDSSDKGPSAAAQIYISTIREVAADGPGVEAVDDPPLPVIYVLAIGEDKIDARVQAEVANVLDAEIDVRFADARAEVVDEDEPGAPVHDDGQLLAVGAVDVGDDEGPVEMDYEVYRSDGDWSRRRATFDRSGDVWSPTSTSMLDEQTGSTPPTTSAP